jgi:hypothetical protein
MSHGNPHLALSAATGGSEQVYVHNHVFECIPYNPLDLLSVRGLDWFRMLEAAVENLLPGRLLCFEWFIRTHTISLEVHGCAGFCDTSTRSFSRRPAARATPSAHSIVANAPSDALMRQGRTAWETFFTIPSRVT